MREESLLRLHMPVVVPRKKSRVTHPLYSVQTLPHGRYYNITYAMKVKIETQECMLVRQTI